MADPLKDFFKTKTGQLVRSGLAEVFGTGVLVLFAGGACTHLGTMPVIGTVGIALAFGLTVMSLASSIGHISGCHVNPAVTLGLLTNGKIDPIQAGVYIVSQLIGGVCGAGILWLVIPKPLGGKEKEVCMTTLGDVDPFQAIVIEAVISFLLVLVVCNVCDANPTLAPLVIGLTVTVGHLFAIPLTGASMNTARSFGPALIQMKWKDHYVYWVGPLLGGALAGGVQRFLFMNIPAGSQRSDGHTPKESKKRDEVTNV